MKKINLQVINCVKTKCKRIDQFIGPKTKAFKHFESLGWKKENKGWVCPVCGTIFKGRKIQKKETKNILKAYNEMAGGEFLCVKNLRCIDDRESGQEMFWKPAPMTREEFEQETKERLGQRWNNKVITVWA